MEKKGCHAEACGDRLEKPRRLCDGSLTANHDHLENEKRVRREIANSNERRRMQSINAGFDSLRILLPPVPDGEKMSKATVLQLTAEYINSLLNRVSLLENEVAVYRRTTGIQPTTIIPDFPTDFGMCRKRKHEEQKKRSGYVRSRRKRVTDPALNSPHVDVCGSPLCHNVRQTSPSTTYNSSTSVSPTSPIPDGTSNTSGRLEHLVMAIEQLEGGRALHYSGSESQDESISSEEHSPQFSAEPYWHSPQEGFHDCSYTGAQDSDIKPLTNHNDVHLLTPVSDVASPAVPANEATTQNRITTDYPVVSKLLNRPIPHKYLHRPQVVVNSSH